MNKKSKGLISLIFISLMFLFSSQSFVDDSCLQARSINLQSDCSANGHSNWNGFWWNSDGVDCWCGERENVTNACLKPEGDDE